jgi:hypothetical protein
MGPHTSGSRKLTQLRQRLQCWLHAPALVAAMMVASAAAAPAEPGFTVAAPDVAPPPVVYLATTNKRDSDARFARSLATYLTRMSGQKTAAQPAPALPKGRAIVVGKLAPPTGVDPGGDGFIIRVTAEQVQISGWTPRGVGIGVYAWLSDLGCRWWSHDEEDVPERPTITIPLGETRVAPPFRQTELMNNEAKSRRHDFAWKGRGASTEVFSGGHTLYPLLKPAAEKHPEFYPYSSKTGKRAANKLHFCYTAPGIAEAVAAALEPVIARHKGNVRDVIYQVGMGDWYGGTCECDRCAAVYAEERWTRPDGVVRSAPSSTLIRMVNRIAEILDATYPGIRIGTFAYMTLEGPPGKTVPHKNVVIWVPHLRHCIIHPAATCGANETYRENLKRWCELAPERVYVWDYATNYGENFLYPFPVIRALGENIRWYAEIGVAGIRMQGNYVSTGGDLAVLKNWVWSRLLWDPELETDELIREFCEGYYGPAAQPVLQYVMTLEELATTSPVHMDEFAKLGRMRQVYLGVDAYRTLKRTLAGKAEKLYGGGVATELAPLWAEDMRAADAARWEVAIAPMLATDLASRCGGPLTERLRTQLRGVLADARAGKNGATRLRQRLGKRPHGTYGKPAMAVLQPLYAPAMADADAAAWEAAVQPFLSGDALALACGEHRARQLRRTLKAAPRNAHVQAAAGGLRTLLAEALAAASSDPVYSRRVREVQASLDAVELWHPGELAIVDDRFVRVDIGGTETWQRVEQMLAHARRASPREWKAYRPYHEQLKPLHGGPLRTLRRGQLEVQVAPWLGGRIRQIRVGSQPLLRVPEPTEKGYPALGGSYEKLSQRVAAMAFADETAAPTQVTLVGNGGGGSSVKHAVRKHLELAEDGSMLIRMTAVQQNRSAKYQRCRATSLMEYTAGTRADAVRVEAEVAGAWQQLFLVREQADDTTAPTAKRWQTALPEGAAAVRLKFASGASVEDRLLAPALASGTIVHDRERGVVTTTLVPVVLELDSKHETLVSHRRLVIQSTGTGSAPLRAAPRPQQPAAADPEADVNTVRPDIDRQRDTATE